MKTKILDANKREHIELCAGVLKTGGIVAFPTETVYGLGADALDEKAVSKIFTTKGRQEDNPLIVHIASPNDLAPLVADIPAIFAALAEEHWPGPLTLIMRKSALVPGNVTAGLDTVAIRMPSHPAALSLIRAGGRPIAAPSANPSGKPSPTKAAHVKKDLEGKIPYILDGGACTVGVESTVLDITGKTPQILRPGGVTYDELKKTLKNVEQETTPGPGPPRSPGMKYRHYAPKAPMTALSGPPEKTAEYIKRHIKESEAALMFDDYKLDHPRITTYGPSKDHTAQAAQLFNALRELDKEGITAIYAQTPEEKGLGQAIANRIKKASGNKVIEVFK